MFDKNNLYGSIRAYFTLRIAGGLAIINYTEGGAMK
jgi:hypothetical protein